MLKEIADVVLGVADDIFHPSMNEKMDAVEAERARLEIELAEIPEPDAVIPHSDLAEIYKRKVDSSATALLDGLIVRIII